MICKYCNASVRDGIRFCPYCHHPVNYAPTRLPAENESISGSSIRARLEGCVDTYSVDIIKKDETRVAPQGGSGLTEIPESYGTILYEQKVDESAVINAYRDSIGNTKTGNTGTGFFLGDGLLATNYHVVSFDENDTTVSSKDIEVNHKGHCYKARIHKVNRLEDVAIIKLQGNYPKELNDIRAELGNSDTVKPGTPLISIGNSGGDGLSFNSFTAKAAPKISVYLKDPENSENDFKVILLNNSAQSGNSGGALYDRLGRVVGIITGAPKKTENVRIKGTTNDDAENLEKIFGVDTPVLKANLQIHGITYAIPIEVVKRLLNAKSSEEV